LEVRECFLVELFDGDHLTVYIVGGEDHAETSITDRFGIEVFLLKLLLGESGELFDRLLVVRHHDYFLIDR
jgi:hypothetical protein